METGGARSGRPPFRAVGRRSVDTSNPVLPSTVRGRDPSPSQPPTPEGSSIPMLRRCFRAQWNGLDEETRISLLFPGTTNFFSPPIVLPQAVRPIWSVESLITKLDLISIKEELYGLED